MRIGKFFKTSTERKRYKIDYDPWLDTGEKVSTVTYEVTNATTPVTVENSQVAADGRSVSFFVAGGADGQNYEVLVTMTTDGGQIKEDEILYVVKDPT